MTHTKRILITADPQEVRVAIVEGGKLSEAYIERRGRRSIAGNIYKGRVDAVLPGMEAAFVDIGLEKNGFLYVNEIVTPDLDDRERRKKPIQDLIKPGQELLVQVIKDPMGTKGARLTMEVSLAGRFMVLAPESDGVGVSKRLPDAERDRLRDLIKKVKTEEDSGLIVRTAAEGASVEELERDVRLLEKLWETTRGHAQRAAAPALVYAEPDLSLQMIRDDLRSDVSEVVIDDERQFHRIASYVRRTSPELLDRIKLYRGKRALFSRYEIEHGIRSTLKRRVDLPSGGYLIFDYAEAFTIVDVNTGRFTGKKRLEDTILKNNLEAAVEVVRQLRLRDVGGIIVVDFIDMASQKNRDAVLKTLQKELEKDRTKVYVVEISPLGLVEMTRQNVADGVREIMTVVCSHCEGTGRVLSEESVAIDNLRALRRLVSESKSEAFQVGLHPSVAAIMIGPGGSKLRELERETGRYFTFEGVDDAPLELLDVKAEGTREEIERAAVPIAEGDELEVLVAEPHMYVETDAIARLESGYVIVVAGAGPYVGQRHTVRVDRTTRTAGYATLLSATPAEPEPEEVIDRESDILEPERRVGERVDVEGRMRRQRRRGGGGERRKEAAAAGGGEGEGGVAVAEREGDAVAADERAEAAADVADAAGEGGGTEGNGTARKRRRRRGGRGRGRGGAGANGAAGESGADADDDEAAEVVGAVGAVAAVGAADLDDEGDEDEVGADEAGPDGAAVTSTGAKRRRRRRRRSGSGGGGTAGGGPRPDAAVEAPEQPVRREPAPARPARADRAPAPERPAAPAPPPVVEPATPARGGLLKRLLGGRREEP